MGFKDFTRAVDAKNGEAVRKMSTNLNVDFSRASTPEQGKVITLPVQKRTLDDAIQAAANGDVPRQPHGNPYDLQAEALLATETVRLKYKPIFKGLLRTPEFECRPPKDIGRVHVKKGAPDLNCDWGGNFFYMKNMNQAREISDMFQGPGELTVRGPDNRDVKIHILEVDNTFVTPNPKKPHIHEVSAKLAVPLQIKTAEGETEQTYHVYEMRFMLRASRDAYRLSEEAYKEKRHHERQADLCVVALNKTAEDDHKLRERWYSKAASHLVKMQEASERRTQINLEDTKKNGTDALVGQHPARTSGTNWSFKPYAQDSAPAIEVETAAPAERQLAMA